VVGEGPLLRQEGYPSAASGGSVLLDRTGGGKPSTDDDELEPVHACFVCAGREFLPGKDRHHAITKKTCGSSSITREELRRSRRGAAVS
jgi:hypothetical protein